MQEKKLINGTLGALRLVRKEIKGRGNWQSASMARGQGAELVFKTFFEGKFNNTNYIVCARPKHFAKLYADNHDIRPDFMIENIVTNKRFFVEVKRQHAGRGNAHERACRYFTPGLINAFKKMSNIDIVIPIWLVFCNGITLDEKRVREIKFWFYEHEINYLLWPNLSDTSYIDNHFENHIKPLLD